MGGAVFNNEALNEGMDYPLPLVDGSLIPWGQSRQLTTSLL